MATSLGRLLSSAMKISIAHPALHGTGFEPVALSSASNSAMRYLCCSTQQAQSHLPKEQSKVPKENVHDEKRQSKEEEEDDGEDGVDVNHETGEIGGPKGPEPTRMKTA
ncbi:hypothetical protein L6164_030343 [Bauhinia variegata]|uniref:Uncharacterized protein n=1 Tax=Bauhinia variegata TaxID=167791 RepID=A0ACB9LDD7_BAUVA|nr:hypothetical protein L6164_030343 [Bauhinia variegata]